MGLTTTRGALGIWLADQTQDFDGRIAIFEWMEFRTFTFGKRLVVQTSPRHLLTVNEGMNEVVRVSLLPSRKSWYRIDISDGKVHCEAEEKLENGALPVQGDASSKLGRRLKSTFYMR